MVDGGAHHTAFAVALVCACYKPVAFGGRLLQHRACV
jgi:hypothetical protein